MNEETLKEPAGVLIKTSLVDFPGHVAATFFLKGCNLHCPYCYNTELVHQTVTNVDFSSLEDLFAHLDKRKNVLSGVVISGGEPLLNPKTPLIIKKAKELGFLVKLDTNGILSEKLSELLSTRELKPDFIAMDLKTSPQKYGNLLCTQNSAFYKNTDFFKTALTESIELISREFPKSNCEFRTVLVPGLVDEEEIIEMSKMIPASATWRFAQFQNGNCVDSTYNELTPYNDEKINELLHAAKKNIPNSCLR